MGNYDIIIQKTWYKVPEDQPINAHDATDWIVCNVEDCKDNVEEGEEKTNEEHDDDSEQGSDHAQDDVRVTHHAPPSHDGDKDCEYQLDHVAPLTQGH